MPSHRSTRRAAYSLAACILALSAAGPRQASAQNWTRAADIPPEYVNAIEPHSGALYAATDSAVYVSTDSGATWAETPSRPPTTVIQTLHSFGGALWVATLGDGAFRTTDGGGSWQEMNAGLSGGAKTVVEFAARGDTLYAGTGGNGVQVLSHAATPAWSAYNSGLFQFGTNSLIASGTTLVGAIGTYIFHRGAGAAQWDYAVFDSTGGRVPLRLARHDPWLFLGTTGGVFRGDTGGGAWEASDISQFPGEDIVAFAADGGRLFAGLNYQGQHWIFSTDDHGSTWDFRAHEFAELLALRNVGGTLWAGRVDGLWWFDLDWITGAEDGGRGLPAGVSLSAGYPNPFNPSTSLEFSLPSAALVELSVHDALGRRVATLATGMHPPGVHAVRWDAADLPSGVYYCRLTAGSQSRFAKAVLIR